MSELLAHGTWKQFPASASADADEKVARRTRLESGGENVRALQRRQNRLWRVFNALSLVSMDPEVAPLATF
jgi:hypothetical protein